MEIVYKTSSFQLVVDKFCNTFLSPFSFFFLSHAHEDHMVGLRHFGGVVYCSNQTRTILRKLIAFKNVNLKVLPLNEWIEMDFGKVKAIPVLHCVGAILFIFCLKDGRNVLFTGDFRCNSEFLEFLNEECDGVLFDKVIYDNTFGNNLNYYQKFPSVTESVEMVQEVIKNSKVKNPIFHLKFNGRIGIEMLVSQLGVGKIHNPFLSKFLPHLFCALGEGVNIHCNKCGCNFLEEPSRVVSIFLSANPFRICSESKDFKELLNTNVYRICYSMHSSSRELYVFLKWVKKNEKLGCEIVPMIK